MFGFGFGPRRPRRQGLMGMLFGNRYYQQGYYRPTLFGPRYVPVRRRGGLGSTLGRLALIGGLSWLGNRALGGFNNNNNNGGGLFGGNSGGGWDQGSAGGSWDDPNSGGQSW